LRLRDDERRSNFESGVGVIYAGWTRRPPSRPHDIRKQPPFAKARLTYRKDLGGTNVEVFKVVLHAMQRFERGEFEPGVMPGVRLA
jgi:hypothetical protein